MQLTPEIIKKNKDKEWILGNFSGVQKDCLIEFVLSGVKYSVIECDYKYCKHRSSHLHKLREGKDCDCHKEKTGVFIAAFYNKAHKVFFMSEEQMNIYKNLFPQFQFANFIVQSSTFKKETVDRLKSLYESRVKNGHDDRWAILSGGSWIKAERQTVEWCEANKLEYDLIGGLPHDKFIEKLSKKKGLVFHPAGFDTCPRIVIESKMLGLELDLNDNVQHASEEWFNRTINEIYEEIKGRPERFWESLKK